MGEDNHIREQWQLLQSLRSTVEGLLVYGVSNVWNVYGGLNRLHSVIEQIFKHGCRIFDPLGEPDCWVFIQGLSWLQPSLAISPSAVQTDDYLLNLPARITSRRDLLWMYKSLESHSLSQKLSWLLSDKEHLLSCLEPWAFLCQESLAEATLICLRAVERNQAALLTEIDPCLFLPGGRFLKNSPKRHRRSSSYPTNFGIVRDKTPKNSSQTNDPEEKAGRIEKGGKMDDGTSEKNGNLTGDVGSEDRENEISLKSWNSLPVLCKDHEVCQKNCPLPLTVFMASNRPEEDVIRAEKSITLADVIKVDYSEAKMTETCSKKHYFNGKKPKIPLRKLRHKKNSYPTKNDIVDASDVQEFSNNFYAERKEDIEKFSSKSRVRKIDNFEKTSINSGAPIIASSGDISKNSDEPNFEESTVNPLLVNSGKREDGNFLSDKIKIETHQKVRRKSLFSSGSAPEFSGSWSLGVEGQKDVRTPKKSFMEDGGSSIQPMATGYFPRPLEGQSLTSFLSSAQFSRANAELDRENAHFSISEAMIAAIEQVKCNRQLRSIDETVDESDEEINNLKQRIRMRRRQRQVEQRKAGNWSRELLSDGKTDTTTTDQSVSPLSSSPGTPSDNTISTDGVDDLEIDDVRNLSQLRSFGASMSMASLYSDADLCRSSPRRGNESALTDSIISAEGVALCLISRFSERHLPRASELQWLVSEQDAPQQLLPMPKNWSANLMDEGQSDDATSQVIPLRGTIEWAPPRPQIIFTPHPPPAKKIRIAKQNYRCAGCGMKVAVEYANRFRYCEYLGRYFCTGCHTNQVALIPGKILSKWDFNRYPVSNFSYRLLDQMAVDPLFQVNDLNPLLYRRVKQLERTRLLRTQLFYLKDFMLTCRFAQSVQEALKKQPNYIFNDPHIYSMQDLVSVKVGTLTTKLSEIVQDCCAHVSECVLCEARGFMCELCFTKGNSKVIFPWELSKVTRCNDCGSCFHIECKNLAKNTLNCPRCLRLRERRSLKG
ncbi:run domain Beclin-1-interacting and cysteine-rich domain-containing protein [Venturia canescens]|uniref:run domain Beclin-1-interacting and cysteine-rich domain-containing protein n=1 Tax=Venturia canescens TaxID=32260 RepID=UPI001C9D4394|nr:run domain Beclin-1-interacting and cysteine-rich domain-containing protein [Venturia canescens]